MQAKLNQGALTLALCMITSAKDEKKAKKLAKSLEKYVDEVIITGPKEFIWIDDFAAARNFNFSQTKADYILWLDADDTIDHPEKLRELIEIAEKKGISGYFFNYQYYFDERGNCTKQHWKLQLIKNDGHFKWVGMIHEDILPDRAVKYITQNQIQRIHHTDKEREKESRDRNLRILLKAQKANPTDPRIVFYIGREYLSKGDQQNGIDCLTEYLNMSGWDDERYEANMLIGMTLFMAGKVDEALLTFNAAILEKEKFPDAYIHKGYCYMQKQQWDNALQNFKISLDLKPESNVENNPLTYSREVWSSIAECYMQLGQLKESQKAITIALKADPQNPENLALQKFLKEETEKFDIAQKYTEIAKYLNHPEKIQRLLTTVPANLADNDMIMWLRNTQTPPKKWGDKSIAVYCGSSIENWNPDLAAQKGIGGSETAVIELTKRLAKLGWEVTVFNDCGAPPEGLLIDGVKWQNFWTFNIGDEFDVLWVWRLPELFDYKLKARLKILDLHDTMTAADLTYTRVSSVDKIFVKSNFHRSLYPKVEDSKFVIVGNGIDLSKFENELEVRDPYRFIYASAPNRGLDILLEMWPKIKTKLPMASLHIFYGWETFYEIEKHNPERMMWMKHIQELMKQDGVINHGRVNQKTLAKEELKSSYWLYPTYFPEIDCITVKEMQAAGVVPITTGYAALAENQLTGVKLEGDVYDPEWQEKYIEEITKATKVKEWPAYNIQQFSWDRITEEWNSQLTEDGKDNAQAEGEEFGK